MEYLGHFRLCLNSGGFGLKLLFPLQLPPSSLQILLQIVLPRSNNMENWHEALASYDLHWKFWKGRGKENYIIVTNIIYEFLILHFNNTVHNLPQEVTVMRYSNYCSTVLPQSLLQTTDTWFLLIILNLAWHCLQKSRQKFCQIHN